MTDDRPRPQYGEYAPEGWVSPNLPAPTPPAPEPEVAAVAERPARRTWDLVLTVGLLVVGAYTVLSNYFNLSAVSAVMDQMFEQYGMGDFTSDEALRTALLTGAIIQTVIWVFVAAMSYWALRRGRLAFWWPLAGGVLANVILVILVSVVLASDPAYSEYITQLTP